MKINVKWVLLGILVILILSSFGYAKKYKSVELYEGWNLVSLPCKVKDNDVEILTKNINSSLNVIFSWSNEDKLWSRYVPQRPPFLDDLKELNIEEGYWFGVEEDITWEIRCKG